MALATLALAGCEKPYPGVSVWSGTTTEFVRALCWQPDATSILGPGDCAQDLLERAASGAQAAKVVVAPGNTVGISVDPAVAQRGWSLKIGGQDLVTGLRDTYYRFTFPEQGADSETGYSMQITANGVAEGARGYWFFQLMPRKS